MKILIAEDDAVSRRLLEKRLRDWGHEVVSTSDGQKALNAFQTEQFPLVITDWMMPEMDGLELVQQIRREAKEYVYIIMLTSKSDRADLVEGMDNGADDFITKPFDREELRVRLRAGERILELEDRLKLKNAALVETNDKMLQSLKAAAVIQKSMLPASIPEAENIQVAWRFKPCDELAGDILNVFQLDEDHIGLYVLDVSGHGVQAALLAVTLSRFLSPMFDRASLLLNPDSGGQKGEIVSPATVANQLNQRFQIDMVSGQFFTFLYCVLNIRTCELRFANAGHPGLVYLPANKDPQLIEIPSLPIGFVENADYQEASLNLASGDRIFLYSDGIPEADNPAGEFFNTNRLLSVLGENQNQPIGDSLDTVLTELSSWIGKPTFKDDITLLGLEIES